MTLGREESEFQNKLINWEKILRMGRELGVNKSIKGKEGVSSGLYTY